MLCQGLFSDSQEQALFILRRKVMIRRLGLSIFVLVALLPGTLLAQTSRLGRIIGEARTLNGDFPQRQLLVELVLRGGVVESVYTDSGGRFGFSDLQPNGYQVVIHDEEYYPVEEKVEVNPDVTPYARVQMRLRPREAKPADTTAGARASGSNPYLVNPDDYNKHFPRKALKQYQRGVDAERKGKHDDAIAHYLSALQISPGYYPAHNNLGSLYLGKSDFKAAEAQFQEVIRIDQNDAQAYFNLGNVFMLTGRYPDSERALSSGLQRWPDSAFGNFLQGSLYGRTGKLSEAEKSLRTALQLDSSMWQAHLQLVNVYLQQNRRPNAITELQGFLKAFPSAPAVPKANELLYKLQKEGKSDHPPQ
jgi:predicted Zn-dependent protease